MLRTAEKTGDDPWNWPKVSIVCCLAKAEELPQQPQLQHNTDARKHYAELGDTEVLDHAQAATKVDYYTGTLLSSRLEDTPLWL